MPARSRPSHELRGTRVVIAGAGLAGLVAARELAAAGADVHVIEARDRLGGRVLTLRGGPLGTAHAEAGGEFIDAGHRRVRALAREVGLRLTPVVRAGFGIAIRHDDRVHVSRRQATAWRELRGLLKGPIEAHGYDDGEWHGSVAAAVARHSLLDLLREADATPRAIAFAHALRGFFVADPAEFSALVAVDQLRQANPGIVRMSRIAGGNDRLVAALARTRRFAVERRHVLRRVTHTADGVRLTIELPDGLRAERAADFVVLTLPPPLLREVEFSPALPEPTERAFHTVTLGAGTKSLLRFATPWWRRDGWPSAYGTNLPVGAVWDAAADQKGEAVLTLFAGGSSSGDMQATLKAQGVSGLLEQLRWLGHPERPIAHTHVTWEHERWSGGAYAVFTPRFDPHDRDLLARAVGRILFAGEHTSAEAQGYMEGAVESGQRVASELRALRRLYPPGRVRPVRDQYQ